ncbi:hypothetical protein EVAR_40242_1 [Eumeta japonica]|uniref:Uncharacterized protein n=1 Tax=Eumeta variegata TaxID=151549 RepID=A0A4C1X7U0_EUMVA|nr:hypothetical protein EVAR_40242_1 [Eumeta japonica]
MNSYSFNDLANCPYRDGDFSYRRVSPHLGFLVQSPRGTDFLRCVRDGGVASCPGVFSSGIQPRRFLGCGSLYGNPVRHPVLASSASLFGRRRFGDFSRERSAARRPFVRRRDVPEEFMWALISGVEHPAGNAPDEFLYGLDTEVASNSVI